MKIVLSIAGRAAVAAGMLGVAALLAACGSSSGGGSGSSAGGSSAAGSSMMSSTQSTSSMSSPSSGSPQSSGSATSQAAQQYLSITAPTTASLTAFLTLPNSSPIATVRTAAAKVVTDESTLISKLRSAQWPAAAKGTIDTLASTAQKEVAVYQQCSKAASVAAIRGILTANKSVIAARTAAAAQVRAAIGLPVEPSGSPTSG